MNAAELMQQGAAHARAGRHAEAADCFEQLAALLPGDAGVWCHLGMFRATTGEFEPAAAALRRALELRPDFPDALAFLGTLLATQQQTGEAEPLLKRAVELVPDRADVLYGYTRLLTESGRAAEAVLLLRDAIARDPRGGDLMLHDKLCMMSNYVGGVADIPAQEVFGAHVRYGRLAPPARPLPYAVDRSPERRLRIGILSADLREHSVTYFLEPFLERLDRGRFGVFVYHAGSGDDAVTARLRTLADGWRSILMVSDDEAWARITADRVDILLELGGHTNGNRLAVAALRPAPVQVNWIGYPNTTGVGAIDARIVDSITDPPGAAEALATERLIRLDPCFLCYRPFPGAPEPGAGHPGPGIVFGSFNNLAKLSPPAIALWSRLLTEVPGSRLVLKGKGLADPAVSAVFASRFGVHGIGPDRLGFLSHTPSTGEHLAAYRKIDIALDPFPYAGTTTTCEALWMGVPVITLAGATHASRVGVSLLSAAGLPELIADSPERYLGIARDLAADAARLDRYRRTLRARLASSPLCDAVAFTARLEGVLRDLWCRWARGPDAR